MRVTAHRAALLTAVFLASTLPVSMVSGQSALKALEVDLTGAQPSYGPGALKAGGTNAAGSSIAVNQYYLTIDGVPAIPVMGEMHYYRYPRQYWEEQLLKMKAGGVNIVATYAHWILHEEREGVWNWSGDRDLRAFVDLAGKLGMKVILRVGPYGHGEVRNGGFPDWLLGRPVTVRSNDPEYLRYVSILYRQIADQVRGKLFADGGPIIAIQLENELQHSASPWALNYPGQTLDFTVAPADKGVTRSQLGTPVAANPRAQVGVEHMKRLNEIALDAGLDAPLWTATGWGNAAILADGTLPVQAAYAYPSWETKAAPSPLYTYKNLQRDPDYAPVSYDATQYPYMAAELGPGMINNYSRRPVIPAQSADALVNRFLGSGSNGIGYYMFQSGTTPRGERSFLADEAFAYPHMSYDFGGPLGEFGEVRPTFQRLKLLHFFMDSFGDRLAPMPVHLPPNAESIAATDVKQVRYAARGANGSGFIFVNNFQDHVKNDDQAARFDIHTPQGNVSLPLTGELRIPAGENMILPVNFDMAGVRLVSATVQPLTKLRSGGAGHFVFFGRSGVARQFVFTGDADVRTGGDGCTVRPVSSHKLVECAPAALARFEVTSGGRSAKVVLLDHDAALKSWVVGDAENQRLLISDAAPLPHDGGTAFRSIGSNVTAVRVYPASDQAPRVVGSGTVRKLATLRGFSGFELGQTAYTPPVRSEWPATNKLTVQFPDTRLPAGVVDVWLTLPYQADTAMAFVGGELVADHFYDGLPWRIGTKRFLGRDGHMLFYFRPLQSEMPFYADLPDKPNLKKGEELIRADPVTFTPEYETVVRF